MIEIREEDLEYTFFRSSGPGGQKKNTTDSAVRLRHIPTNTVIIAQKERSQWRNKAIALETLRHRLEAENQRKRPRIATRVSRRAKIRRLEAKRQRGGIKRLRGPIRED